jgi:hypothetical protein
MIGFKRVSGFKKYLIDMTTPKVPDDAIVRHVKMFQQKNLALA